MSKARCDSIASAIATVIRIRRIAHYRKRAHRMKQEEQPELKEQLFDSLAGLKDIYPDFDVCTWTCAKNEVEVLAIIGLIAKNPEITTSDIISFQEWLEDQREDGNL